MTNGNAVPPGRTNWIEDVAEALDCDRIATAGAVDGNALARMNQRLLQSPDRGGELTWN